MRKYTRRLNSPYAHAIGPQNWSQQARERWDLFWQTHPPEVLRKVVR